MPRTGVTYEDVAQAASQLLGEEKPQTIEQVRRLLGTGSSNTLSKHLRHWKEQTFSQTALLALKDDLPEDLIALIKGLWNQLTKKAEDRVLALETTHADVLAELELKIMEYQGQSNKWQNEHGHRCMEIKRLSDENLSLTQALEFQQKENATLNIKQDQLHQLLQQKQERTQELNQLSQQAQKNLEHFRETSRQQQLINDEKHARHLQQIESNLNNSQNENQLLKDEIKSLCNKLELSSKEVIVLKSDHNHISEKFKDVVQETIGQKEELRIAEDLIKQLKTQFKNLQGDLQNRDITIKLCEEKLFNRNDEAIKLQEENAQIMQNLTYVQTHKAQLEGRLIQLEKFISAPMMQIKKGPL